MRLDILAIFIGVLLVVGSIVASIVFHFYFWYSFYVIGAFLLFGGLNYNSTYPSIFSYILKKKWKQFFILYGVGISIGFFVDIVYGRTLSHLWYYPHLSSVTDIIFPVFIYYPFGGFQLYELFYFLKSVCTKRFSQDTYYTIPPQCKMYIAYLLIVFLIVGMALPIVFYGNTYANEMMILIMIFTTLSPDAIAYILHKDSLLFAWLEGNKAILLTSFTTWLCMVLLSEVPNTFSWEWVYYHIPFTTFEILKINILIFTFGWFFLVFFFIRFIDVTKILFHLSKN